MESMQLKKIEDAKIQCAKKLFSKLNGGMVHYDVADTYQHLMDIMSRWMANVFPFNVNIKKDSEIYLGVLHVFIEFYMDGLSSLKHGVILV